MKLYEINAEIENILNGNVDEETGEIVVDEEALESLIMEREEKIEHIALFIKNANADAKLIREEEKALAERRRSLENRAEKASNFLANLLNNQRFTTAKCDVKFRRSEKVDVDDDFVAWAASSGLDDVLNYKEPSVSLSVVKQLLKDGFDFKGKARMVENYSMSIK